MKKIATFVFLIAALSAFADEAYQEWLKGQNQTFENYKESHDAQFKNFLEKNWKEFESFKGIDPGFGPKPKKLPVAKPKEEKAPEDSPIVENIPMPAKKPKIKPLPKEENPSKKNLHKFDFFGKTININYDANLQIGNETNNKTIADFFEKLSKSSNQTVIKQLSIYKKQMRLNDYSFVLLTQKAGQSLFVDERRATLFAWFALLKSGYVVKVAYYKKNICLLLPTDKTIYATPFIQIDGNRYFVSSLTDNSKFSKLNTYDGSYPNAKKGVQMVIKDEFDISDRRKESGYKFSYKNKAYFIPTSYNLSNIELFEKYPQTEIDVYFGTPLAKNSKEKMLNALAEIIQGETEAEAVNILLAFVQHAFEYKTDDEQFGREKSFFPEELFYYKFSDCEDRSILFANLVESLLGLDVVGIEYPGHLATGVAFSTVIGGDSFDYEGKKFTICDPTYINATYGMAMPQFKDVKPKVVAVK